MADINDSETYFDFMVPKMSVENFQLDKLAAVKNNMRDLQKKQSEDLEAKLLRKSQLVSEQTKIKQASIRQKNFDRIKRVVDR